MTEMFDIILKCASMILLAVVTYVVIPAIKDWRATKLNAEQRQQLSFWVETAVLWAKQWMQSETGEAKKAAVMDFVMKKIVELGLPYSEEDVDKAVEACYNTVKDVVDATTGVVEESAGVTNA